MNEKEICENKEEKLCFIRMPVREEEEEACKRNLECE